MIALWRELGPTGTGLLALAAVLAVALLLVAARSRSRGGRATLPLALVAVLLLLYGTEAGRFDGVPHFTEKLDATTFVWAASVVTRGAAGVAALLLAVPLGIATRALLGTPPRTRFDRDAALGGLGVIGAPGAGLLLSALKLQRTLVLVLAAPEPGRVAILRAGIAASDRVLLLAGAISVVTAVMVAAALRSEAE